MASDVIAAVLSSKHAALCGQAATCPLQTAFEGWLKLPLALDSSQPAATATTKK